MIISLFNEIVYFIGSLVVEYHDYLTHQYFHINITQEAPLLARAQFPVIFGVVYCISQCIL